MLHLFMFCVVPPVLVCYQCRQLMMLEDAAQHAFETPVLQGLPMPSSYIGGTVSPSTQQASYSVCQLLLVAHQLAE